MILSGWPTNNAKTGGCVATWVMKADLVIFVGLPFRTGRGWVARISWRNLFNAPVGIRFENAANTLSMVGKSWPSESGFARGCEEDRRPGQEGKTPSKFQLDLLPGLAIALPEVPFIDQQEAGPSLLDDDPGDLGVLLSHAFYGIE